jgi:hypothetical protein
MIYWSASNILKRTSSSLVRAATDPFEMALWAHHFEWVAARESLGWSKSAEVDVLEIDA